MKTTNPDLQNFDLSDSPGNSISLW